MTEDAKKLFPRRVTTPLKLLSPPPPKKSKFFYLQNGYLDFCSNHTILEIKGWAFDLPWAACVLPHLPKKLVLHHLWCSGKLLYAANPPI